LTINCPGNTFPAVVLGGRGGVVGEVAVVVAAVVAAVAAVAGGVKDNSTCLAAVSKMPWMLGLFHSQVNDCR